jgi:hypothetical protein
MNTQSIVSTRIVVGLVIVLALSLDLETGLQTYLGIMEMGLWSKVSY